MSGLIIGAIALRGTDTCVASIAGCSAFWSKKNGTSSGQAQREVVLAPSGVVNCSWICCDTFPVSPNKLGRLLMRGAPVVNAPIAALANSRRFGRLINRNITMLTYTGRRSGRTYSIPVAYRRSGGEIVINVSMPEVKTWWRNFLDTGGPLTLHLDETERAGHAVATQDEKGAVTVTVRLAGENS